MPTSLLSRRLIFVTGKGGVGKSTVARALGIAGARRGMRVMLADLEPETSVGAADAHRSGKRVHRTEPVDGVPGLDHLSIDPQAAMEEYLLLKLPGPAGQLLRQSKLFGTFAMATPALRELLCIGKLWELARLERLTAAAAPYDLVVVDAPASGHGAAILRTPRMFADIARVGPIASQAQKIAVTLADEAFTAVVVVSAPEELAVNETLMVTETLRAAADPLEPQAIVLNGMHASRYTDAELSALSPYSDRAPVALAVAEGRRAAAEREQERRLRDAFGERLTELPYLVRAQLELADFELLAEELV